MSELVMIAVNRHLLVGIAPLVIGLVIVAALVGAVVYGTHTRKRISKPSRTRPPEGSQTGVEEGHVTPAEIRPGNERLLPHEISGQAVTTEEEESSERGPRDTDENGNSPR